MDKKEGKNTGRNWAVDGVNGLYADRYSNPSKCNGKFLRKHCMPRWTIRAHTPGQGRGSKRTGSELTSNLRFSNNQKESKSKAFTASL